jgi:type II secretory pathway pseudopilin PulG
VNARRRRQGEGGETLLEILIAVAIMGIAMASILGLMQGAIGASTIHREQSDAGNLLDNLAEYMQNESAAPYVECPTAQASYSVDLAAFNNLAASPSSNVYEPRAADYALTLTVTAGTIGAPGADPSIAYTTTCSAASADQGVQRLTLAASSTDSKVAESIQIVKWRR